MAADGLGRESDDAGAPALLFDGGCGLCVGSARSILRRERRRTLRFAALGGRFATAVLARHPELAHVDSLIWFEPAAGARAEGVFVRSDAALRVFRYLGWPWRILTIARLLPRRWRDAVYDVVARHRIHLAGEARQPLAPSAEARARFLD